MFVMQHEVDGQHYLIEIRAAGQRRWQAAARSLDPWGPESVAAECDGASMTAAFQAVLARLVDAPRPQRRAQLRDWLGFWRPQVAG